MKIQIDTELKVIRLESTINLGEFMVAIKQLLPDSAWKAYSLEVSTNVMWWGNQYPTYPWIQYNEMMVPTIVEVADAPVYNIEYKYL